MVGTFLRHRSNIWLTLGLAALMVGFLAGVLPFSLLWLVVGALTFYVSEYGFHRFSFHASRHASPSCANCSTGCTMTITPSRSGSICCSCRSGFWFPISP